MTVPEEMATELANKKAEREALRGVIQQWNANRLDLFELSEPNEDLEFHGVMRFYFQDSGQKVATKCIRVASDATSQAVIETLIEKFRPDMRMLSVPEYALYEIHENGEERKLGLEEKPLLVQLNWHIDDREGRFLLRRIDDKTNAQGVGFSSDCSSFRRKLSKREKKQMKKQEKLSRLKSLEQDENTVPVDQNGVAEKLYTELPETSFTRSISNPEAVMRRRRQQKLERKLQQFRSKDGGPDTGGTLKIYGEALCKDVPYKTLLLSVRDSAVQVVREMLSKYGLDKVDPQQYCLVQVNGENVSGGAQQEYILDDDECPLAILMNHPSARGSIMFHVRRRPADYVPRKRKKKPAGKWNELDHRYEDERLPFLLELNPDGSDISNGAGVRHRLQPNVTEVGSERPIGPQAVQAQTLTLTGPTVMPRHCVIAFTENIVTLTPCSRDAHTYVNNQRIHQTTILQNGAIIKFGRLHTFRFIDPSPEDRIRQRHDSGRQMDYGYDRHSPDTTSQEANAERYGSGSGTPNGGQSHGQGQIQDVGQGPGSHPSSPSKSAAAAAVICRTRSPTQTSNAMEPTHNYETTFDLDGNVETASLTSSRDGNRIPQTDRQPRGTDPILPAVLEFLEETEETFLHAVITDVEPSAPQFKLAPTYTLYLAARYRASTHYRPELQPTERAHRLTVMLANVATMIQRVIQERYMDASSLALWLANGSELLHMLKNDRHVGAFSTRAQDILVDAVHTAFASLVRCVSLELAPAMSQFMADADEPAKEAGVLQIFSNTMALLRRCRVNAALTIQLFSHLFHAINATAFNALVSNGNLCVRWFGRRLKARLNALETWAERQGLDLASQCHLATIMQATHLLQAPKYNAEELATLSSTCFKLNSLQVRALLQKYQPAADEPRLPGELIENVVRVAESVADTLARADGREIRLEEEPTLALALLLPEDGYSCEVIRGVPPGLAEFLVPLQRDGLCRMAPQPTSSGYWTIYMIDHLNNLRSPSAMSNRSGGYSCHVGPGSAQPEIHVIKLHKSTNGMGLSIVAAKGAGQDRLGIYIKSVVAGGAADADGRLTAGDQLLKVDGQSLVGITQEKAAEYLVRTGPVVTLEVAKQGAIYHGLATLLSQPSPVMTRAHKVRPKSEHFDPARLQEANEQPPTSYSLGNLLTVPRHATTQESLINLDVDRFGRPAGAILSQLSKNRFYNGPPNPLSLRVFNEDPAIPLPSRNPRQATDPSSEHTDPISRSWNDPEIGKSSLYPNVEPFPNATSVIDFGEFQPSVSIVTDLAAINLLSDDDADRPPKSYDLCLESIPFIDQTDEIALGPPIAFGQDTSTEENDLEKKFVPDLPQFFEPNKQFFAEPGKIGLKDVDQLDKEDLSSNTTEEQFDPRENAEAKISTPKMYTVIPELNLDLSGLESDVSSDISSLDKCWKSPEEVRLGYGRVAALAKHFSKLGDAGLVKFKSTKLVDSRQFVSEPDVSCRNGARANRSTVQDRGYKSELDLCSPPSDFRNEDQQIDDDLKKEDVRGSGERSKMIFNKKEMREGKLSLAEQRQIIKQLEEFSNLDNVDAPLCIPADENCTMETGGNLELETNWPGRRIPKKFLVKVQTVASSRPTDSGSWLKYHVRCERPFSSSCPNLEKAEVEKVAERRSHSVSPEILRDENYLLNGKNTDGRKRPVVRLSRSCENFSDGRNELEKNDCENETCVRSLSIDSSHERDIGLLCNEEKSLYFDPSKGKTEGGNQSEFDENVVLLVLAVADDRGAEKPRVEQKLFPVDESSGVQSDQQGGEITLQRRKDRGSLEIASSLRPRRMSERDLPSRLGRDTTTSQQQMHTSKSVPALHNVGTESKQQHEVFNPGYSRASSSNSVTPPVQPPPMPAINGASSLRSRSSHNLHDSARIGSLPPSGLVSRQQSSPNLNPSQTIGSGSNNSNSNNNSNNGTSILQANEAERFYQNLSVYRNQDVSIKQGQSPLLHQGDRSPLLQSQKSSRGSQNSLNRPSTLETVQGRDRPISAYIPQGQPQSYLGSHAVQQSCAPPPRSQSSRDIIRQEAKLQEMQEEVRRRELRGGMPTPLNQHRGAGYNARPGMANQSVGSIARPTKPLGSTPNLGPIAATGIQGSRQLGPPSYNYSDAQYGSYVYQYGKPQQHTPGLVQYGVPPSKGKNEMARSQPGNAASDYGREQVPQEVARPYGDQNRHFAWSQSMQFYPNGSGDMRNGQYNAENLPNRTQTTTEGSGDIIAATRPALSEEEYRESPPPPPLNTSTHPLYSKPSDSRYTASMQDPPRGGYYPASGTGTVHQPRQYQYSATNPWQREEREKEQARRREAARQWRDQQIAELSGLSHRTAQQDEQLRALQLERDFQKRAEEAANQQDDDEESNDLESESMQRVQCLLRTAAATQERNSGTEQHHNLSRANNVNQSVKGTVGSQLVGSPAAIAQSISGQQISQNTGTSGGPGQSNSSLHLQATLQHSQSNQMQSNVGQSPMSPIYSSSLTHFGTAQKSYPSGMSQVSEDREMQRKIEEVKRKQSEFDEAQKKREEEVKLQQLQHQQLQMQQMYHQQQSQHFKNQQALYPSMLRLDSLVINGPGSPSMQSNSNDAPPPPERGSSYAVMSQQSALRSNCSTTSGIMPPSSQQPASIKRVSFHDSNANAESMQRNVSSATSALPSSTSMDAIREDPNKFINDAENLLASPKTPEGPGGGPFTGSTPGVIGAQEVYKDPRQKRLAEKQKQQQQNSHSGPVPEKLSFKEKMKMFAMETGEDGTPRDKVKISRAQREIDNIGSPLAPSSSNSSANNNNNNNNINNNNNNNNRS